MANQTNGNQFRDDEIIRLRQACLPWAGKASAEFRSIYPVPLRGSEGSFIILEQPRDGKMVKFIHPKIGGRQFARKGSGATDFRVSWAVTG